MIEWVLLLVQLANPAAWLCADAFAGAFVEAASPSAQRVCVDLVRRAEVVGVEPQAAMAVAYHETKFVDAPSYAGRRLLDRGTLPSALPAWSERSALQCKPQYFCPDGKVEGCDYLFWCLLHLKKQWDHPRVCTPQRCVRIPKKEGWERHALERYKNPYSPADGYGGRVHYWYRRITRPEPSFVARLL